MKNESKFIESENCYVVFTPNTTHYIAMGSDEKWDDNYYYYTNYYYYNNYDNYYYYYYNNYYNNYTLLDTSPNY